MQKTQKKLMSNRTYSKCSAKVNLKLAYLHLGAVHTFESKRVQLF